MFGVDALQLAFNVQSCVDGSTCPGSTFNAVTAAYATLGYYWQADLLYFLTKTGLSQIAGLIYILAGFSGIMAMVLGAPPRNYVWFFIGPAVYNWLVATTEPVQGVRILSAAQESNEEMQKEVWRLAEVGLRNSNYIVRLSGTASDEEPPTPDAEVSLFFVWVDTFVSDLIASLIEITGVYTQDGGEDGNVEPPPNGARKNWSVLTDLKWANLEDITSAKLKDGDIRDAFVTFLVSECGDILAKHVDKAAWAAAASAGGARIPETVFLKGDGTPTEQLTKALRKFSVPIPDAFKNMIGKGMVSSNPPVAFKDSADYFTSTIDGYIEKFDNKGGISCDAYLWILVHAFRYEAGHIYFQLVGNHTGEFKEDPDSVIYNLLYGWGVGNGEAGDGDRKAKRKNYLIDLILVHLFRNEFAIAPKPVDERYSASHEIESYVDSFARTVGSKTKYGEIYSWAMMLPYIQGVTLYILAAAYPFAALMVIIPGWHKTIITWASFWIWVKIWDLGFAIVKVVERSVWAMIGNNPNMQNVTEKVLEMSKWGKLTTECPDGGSIDGKCFVPQIKFTGPEGGLDTVDNTFKIFDRSLTLATNLDLDLSNSYYIYIMAALYFAVPGVTGQIVLGAKAGASSLVGGMISGFSEKVSGAAQSGYQGDRVNQIQTNAGSLQQASEAKAMRQSGLGSQAIKEGNRAAEANLDNNALGTLSSLTNGMVGASERKQGSVLNHYQPARVGLGMGYEALDSMGNRIGGFGKQAPGEAPGGEAPAGSGQNGGGGGNAAVTGVGRKGGGGALKFPKAGLPLIAAMAEDEVKQDHLENAQMGAALNQNRSIGQYGAQSEAGRAGLHGQRIQGYSGFHAASQAYQAKRAFSNQIAGSAAASAGLFAGSLAAQKPTASPDAAMSGLLNTYGADGSVTNDAVADANFGASGAFGNFASGGRMSAKDGGYVGRTSGWAGQMTPMNGQAMNNIFPGRIGLATATESLTTADKGVSVGVDTSFRNNAPGGDVQAPKSLVKP